MSTIIDGVPYGLGLRRPKEVNLSFAPRVGSVTRTYSTPEERRRAVDNVQPFFQEMKKHWLKYGNTLNQGQNNGCAGHTGAALVMWRRLANGYQNVKLSGNFIYARLNRGSDNGLLTRDVALHLTREGTVPYELQPMGKWAPRDVTQAAMKEVGRFKTTDSGIVQAVTFEDIIDSLVALQPVGIAVDVGANFNKFDRFGCCGYSSGMGNHAVAALWVEYEPTLGDYIIYFVNSWGDWGPEKDGFGRIVRKHLQNTMPNHEHYGVASVELDPKSKEDSDGIDPDDVFPEGDEND